MRRVGSNQTQQLDVRVIAASNRDVIKQVEMERFRQDLFYRLNAVTVHLPPLRERREDILPLASHFANRTLPSKSGINFSPEALCLLEQYSWPGNIRELENVVVRAVALSSGVVRPEDLPEQLRHFSLSPESDEGELPISYLNGADARWLTLAEVERDYLERVLRHTKGNKQAATRILNVDRKTVERMIKRHGVAIQAILN